MHIDLSKCVKADIAATVSADPSATSHNTFSRWWWQSGHAARYPVNNAAIMDFALQAWRNAHPETSFDSWIRQLVFSVTADQVAVARQAWEYKISNAG